MSIEAVDDFVVATLNDSDKGVRTWVSHQISSDGAHDVVRIAQECPDRPDENDVVILTRQDFERIANVLKGH